MTTIREACLEFFQKEDIQRYIKEIMRPVVNIIYNEIYPYIWSICFYNVFLIIITLANLCLLLWIRNTLLSFKYNQGFRSEDLSIELVMQLWKDILGKKFEESPENVCSCCA